MVLNEGEAGIGKTRLLQEAWSIAHGLRMWVCFGRCYEDLTLSYLPFVESLVPKFEELADAKQILGPDLEVINRFLHRAGALPPPGPSMSEQADQDKRQLFLAIVALAQTSATLFLIDDLHWADRLSLDLFEHLAFTVADAAVRGPVPLLIVGTYRPMEVGERLLA